MGERMVAYEALFSGFSMERDVPADALALGLSTAFERGGMITLAAVL